jgi:superfamily II DNA or RNA helicase
MSDPREAIQEDAFKHWIDNDRRGTIEAITGIGKTFIALRAIAELPSDAKILYLAETNERWKDLSLDITKYNEIYGVDLSTRNIEMMCYQSAYKKRGLAHDLVICDEIHDSLSPEYAKYYVNNCSIRMMGLSATIEDSDLTIMGREVTKLQFLNEFAPVCFSYKLADGQKDGTTRPLKVHIVEHRLDKNRRNVKAGTKAKPFMTSEAASYNYWDKRFKQTLYMPPDIREFPMRHAVRKRAELLYSLPSKVELVKELLETLNGKTLIFGNHLETLEKVTPNIIRSAPKGISAKAQADSNRRAREMFDRGEIDVIGSFKMLKQGANLSEVDNVIVMSYYGKERDLIQRIGRLRMNGSRLGNVYIPVTIDTQEEKWFKEMTKSLQGVEFVTIPFIKL